MALGKYRIEILIRLERQAGPTRHPEGIRLNGELEFEAQQAIHARDDASGKALAQLAQIFAEPGHREVIGDDELKHFEIEVQSGTHPLARGPLAAIEDRDHHDRQDRQEDEHLRYRIQEQMIRRRVQPMQPQHRHRRSGASQQREEHAARRHELEAVPQLDYISGRGLAAIEAVAGHAALDGRAFVVCGLQDAVLTCFELAGLLPALIVEADRKSALARVAVR